MKSLTKFKKQEFWALFFWPIIASLFSFAFKINPIESLGIFLAIPCIYLTILLPNSASKATVFSIVAGVPLMVITDYVMHATEQWFVPTSFSFRLLTLIPVEDIIWAILSIYLVVMFYEYFLESHRERLIWHRRMTFFSIALAVSLVVFFFVYKFSPNFLANIPYAYLVFGTVVVLIPTLIELFRRPTLIKKFFAVGVVFFFWNLVYEVTALRLGWWVFPSNQYLGLVSIFGVSFPYEEFFFWLVLLSSGILSYYEVLDDNEA